MKKGWFTKMLADLLRELLGGNKKPTTQKARPNNNGGSSKRTAPQKDFKMYEDNSFQGDPKEFMSKNPGYRFFEDNTFSKTSPQFRDNPTFAGNLNPRYEDGYDTTIKYLGGPVQQQQVSPTTMGRYGGPRNIRVGGTNYMQGSNPFTSQPLNNVYPNINPFNQDDTLRGDQIQSPNLDRYFN